MRISDWSSDVCSSDLCVAAGAVSAIAGAGATASGNIGINIRAIAKRMKILLSNALLVASACFGAITTGRRRFDAGRSPFRRLQTRNSPASDWRMIKPLSRLLAILALLGLAPTAAPAADAPQATLYTGATVIDGTGGAARADQDILVEGERIVAIGTHNALATQDRQCVVWGKSVSVVVDLG